MSEYVNDFNKLPLSIIYGISCPNEKLDNFLYRTHVPSKRIRITRSPAPLLQDLNIAGLQKRKNHLRYVAHQTQNISDWENFRSIRNQVKSSIKSTKKTFL